MISAWVVTSSAVEGSSAISSSGIARQRGGERHALAHAARQLERHAVGDGGIGDADLGQPPRDLGLARRAARELRPAAQHLVDVLAAPHQRVQHRERVLQQHRDAVAADCAAARAPAASSGRRRRAAPMPVEVTPGGSRRAIALAVSDLPDPDSPTMASGLAARRARSRSGVVMVRLPSGRARRSRGPRPRGTACARHRVSRSNSQSPIRFMLTAVRMIIPAGSSRPDRVGEQEVAVLEQHAAPVGRARLDAEAEEREAGEVDQREGEVDRHIGEDDRQHVGQDVDEQDARLRDAERRAPHRHRAAAAARAPRCARCGCRAR